MNLSLQDTGFLCNCVQIRFGVKTYKKCFGVRTLDRQLLFLIYWLNAVSSLGNYLKTPYNIYIHLL